MTQPNEEQAVRFNIRKDQVKGYVSNALYPELPAILQYLKPHDGKVFASPAEFQEQVLDGFLDYLDEHKVPNGHDSQLRRGLCCARFPERFDNPTIGKWDYEVLTPATNGPRKCVFGGLEIIVKPAA